MDFGPGAIPSRLDSTGSHLFAAFKDGKANEMPREKGKIDGISEEKKIGNRVFGRHHPCAHALGHPRTGGDARAPLPEGLW
jgi:hypothetical protein